MFSGVGHLAIQMAKALGLYTVRVAGPSNMLFVKGELGADEVGRDALVSGLNYRGWGCTHARVCKM